MDESMPDMRTSPLCAVKPRLAAKRGGRQMAGLADRTQRKPAGRSLPTTAAHRKGRTEALQTKKIRLAADIRLCEIGLLNPVASFSARSSG